MFLSSKLIEDTGPYLLCYTIKTEHSLPPHRPLERRVGGRFALAS